jgi:hypothetical protein
MGQSDVEEVKIPGGYIKEKRKKEIYKIGYCEGIS